MSENVKGSFWQEVALAFVTVLVVALALAALMNPELLGNVAFSLLGPQRIGYVNYEPALGEAWDRAFVILRARGAGQVEIVSQDFSEGPEKFFKENAAIMAAAGFSEPEKLSGKDLQDWEEVKAALTEYANLQKQKKANGEWW